MAFFEQDEMTVIDYESAHPVAAFRRNYRRADT